MERVDANLVPFAQNNPSGYRFAFGTDTATDDINVNYNDNIKKGWGTTPNEFPEVEDFNAFAYTSGYLTAYLYHMGIAEWNDKQKYRQYSRVIGSDGKIYKAKTGTDLSPNVDNNPTTDTTNWEIDIQFDINSLTAKTTPVDTDNLAIQETGGLLKKLSWANIKATLKTYFDTLYVTLSGNQTIADIKTFTSSPIVPTPTAQDNSTKVATTAYVDGKMVLGTAVNSTSGAAIDFTGIPSWVKRITVMFDGVSTNGASLLTLKIGTSGGIESTGYKAGAWITTTASECYTSLVEFPLSVVRNTSSTSTRGGILELVNISNNTWCISGNLEDNTYNITGNSIAGSKTLSGTLARIRITTVNGTDTFDAGSINIMYEG